MKKFHLHIKEYTFDIFDQLYRYNKEELKNVEIQEQTASLRKKSMPL